jgi:xanthine dehydrogenase accessory factor
MLAARRGQDSWRLVALDGAPDLAAVRRRRCAAAGQGAGASGATTAPTIMRDQDGRAGWPTPSRAPRAHLMLFGAGHVGAAIVRVLGELPCRVTWVDERDDMFPANLPANVTVEATDTPEALAAQRRAGHQLPRHDPQPRARPAPGRSDPETPGGRLVRPDRIATKRKQFERRLRERGVERARIDAMVCPIGVPGIAGKAAGRDRRRRRRATADGVGRGERPAS